MSFPRQNGTPMMFRLKTNSNSSHDEMDVEQQHQVNISTTCKTCPTQIDWQSSAVWDEITLAVQWAVFATALPGLCYAAWRLYTQTRPDQAPAPPPLYTINLLVFDLIQTSVNPIYTTLRVATCYCDAMAALLKVYEFGVLGNICFMMCISAER